MLRANRFPTQSRVRLRCRFITASLSRASSSVDVSEPEGSLTTVDETFESFPLVSKDIVSVDWFLALLFALAMNVSRCCFVHSRAFRYVPAPLQKLSTECVIAYAPSCVM